jgi:uncharacterized membrane protein
MRYRRRNCVSFVNSVFQSFFNAFSTLFQHSDSLMLKYFAAYAAAALVMVALDVVWLGYIAKPLYQQGIGHLMAEQPNIAVAIIFYVIFAAGLMVFAIVPNMSSAQWSSTLISAALFGFFTYATYDLSNLATLKAWPTSLAIIDMAWGTVVSTLSAAAAKFAMNSVAASG